MLEGRNVWNEWVQKDMGEVRLGGRTVYTFLNMKKNFYEILQDTAQTYSHKVGIVDNWGRGYDYKTILEMVDDLAFYLKTEKHVEKQSHVGLILNNGIEFVVSFYAVCKLGAVAVPFPTKYREPEIRSLVEKADLKCVLVSEDFEGWTSAYEQAGIEVLITRREEKEYGFSHLCMQKAPKEKAIGDLEDEAILMFTSGTTSASKGVVLKNYNICHAVMIYQRLLELTAEDKTIIPVPIYHITGLVALLGLFVYTGGTIYLHKRYDSRRILEEITRNRITFLHGAPTVLALLLECQEEFPKLESIRTLACGGGYMPIETMKKLHQWMPKMKFQSVYGMTETSSPGTIFPYDAATSIYAGAQGRPIPGLCVKILDEHQRELPDGETGVIYLRGANICEYYYKLQTSLITKDGWLNTGDMGYINEDSYVYIVDRRKDMINRGGEKIWCIDVEEEIRSLKGVKDAAVVGIPSKKYGEAAAAAIVPEADAHLTETDVKELLKCRMARYKIPEEVIFLEALPRTPGLKTDKRKIQRLFNKKGGQKLC